MLSFIQMCVRVVLTIFPAAILKKKVREDVYLNLAAFVDTFVFPDDQGVLTVPTSGTASDPCTNP